MKLWEGNPVAESLYRKIGEAAIRVQATKGRPPGLGLLLVGNNSASEIYVRMKGEACAKYGLHSRTVKLPETATFEEVAAAVDSLNLDPAIDGFIIQLPLPKHLPERILLDMVNPEKDADCLTSSNLGRLVLGTSKFLPCTPGGIMEMLHFYDAPIAGKYVLVIGRSQIVGRPMSILLSHKGVDATVTVAHSRSEGLNELIASADGVIAAIGVAGLFPASLVKPGGWIVDVGMNRVPADNPKGYRLTGDVLFDRTEHLLGHTPVPKGVGPMTIASLLTNCVKAAEA